MALEITGKVSHLLPLESGEGKNGTWKKQYFVVEYMDGSYAKKVCIMLWGDKTDMGNSLKPGTEVKVAFNVESREYNGRWYTDVRAWKVDIAGNNAAPSSSPEPAFSSPDTYANAPDNDLPF
ncbi:MAG TPA: DUF3127 domain-containing protein [Bacteroidia bacterium]|nr:DUF3127 domain-containing protein [Bacteroidia bacterium]